MIHLGVIGYPLGHSLSPTLHAAALQACGLEGDYSLFPIHPDDKQSLKDLLSHVRSGEIQGLNVTIPHKQTVIPFLDELTPIAESIGAVNTIYLRDSRLIGHNTDAPGFLSDLKKFLATETRRHTGSKALILGAGGGARAIVYALLSDGWNITVAARRVEQAESLAVSFECHKLQATNYKLSNIELSNISLIVNTTPVGMTPNTNQSPWPENLPLPSDAAIYDLVYHPRVTRFVREACSAGLSATTGLGMLVEQAALAFEIWTSHRPPRAAMFNAINRTTY